MKRAEKREHLIDVAASVFNRVGYHAAGVDLVIAEAGIAKTTLYRHFASKEELIVAVLEKIDKTFRTAMRNAVDHATSNPDEKLLATFDFLFEWFKGETFQGCPFVSAAGEFGERPNIVFEAAAMHKRLVISYFEELARGAAYEDPEMVAEEINILHEGATAVAHLTGDSDAATRAKKIAAKILKARPRIEN